MITRAALALGSLVALGVLASCGEGRARTSAPAAPAPTLDEGRAAAAAGDHAAAVAAYDRALAGLPEGPDAADAHFERGLSLDALHRFDEALAALDRAAASRAAESPRSWPAIANVQNARAGVLQRLGRFDEAVSAAREAVAATVEHGQADTPAEATVRYTLGSMLVEQRALEPAIAELDRAVQLNARLRPGSRQHLESMEVLASAYDYAERYDEAQALFREVLRQAEAQGAAPQIARALTNLALNLSFHEQDAEAVPLLERALVTNEATYGPRSLETATTLNGLGSSLVQLDQLERAEEVLLRAVSIREEVLGPNHPAVASPLFNLSSVRMAQERDVDALALVDRVIAIRRAALPPDHPWLVNAQRRRAELLATVGPQ